MGNRLEHAWYDVEDEYERVIEEAAKKKKTEEKDYVLFDELLWMELPEEIQLDLQNTAVLYYLDGDRDGRFSLDDLQNFFEKIENTSYLVESANFKYLTETERNVDLFYEWFEHLFTEVFAPVTYESFPDVQFLPKEAVKFMYSSLRIQQEFNCDLSDFVLLMQRAAEEVGLLRIEEETLDGVIPVEMLRFYVEQYVHGMSESMEEVFGVSGNIQRKDIKRVSSEDVDMQESGKETEDSGEEEDQEVGVEAENSKV